MVIYGHIWPYMCVYKYIYIYIYIYGFVRKVRCAHLQLTYPFEKMALKYTPEIYPKYTFGRGVYFTGIFHGYISHHMWDHIPPPLWMEFLTAAGHIRRCTACNYPL